MARPPRILLPHTVVMITSRVQQGLPFTCTPLMELLLWSALTVAYNHHPIRIIAFVVMGNHIHLIALVEDPVQVESFMERFKCETAHAVNRLLGRRQVTVWCEGYDSPTILTLDDLIEKLAYLYTNPVKACRTDSIQHYSGVSSWSMFSTGQSTRNAKRIRRTFIDPMPLGRLTLAKHELFATTVEKQATESLTFVLDPHAWMKAFPSHIGADDFDAKIMKRVKEVEADLERSRRRFRISLPSQTEVLNQPMDIAYAPKKFGKRMWCICSNIPLRVAFIHFIKDLRARAKEVKHRWLNGGWMEPFPPGLFPPCLPTLANIIPSYIQRCLAAV